MGLYVVLYFNEGLCLRLFKCHLSLGTYHENQSSVFSTQSGFYHLPVNRSFSLNSLPFLMKLSIDKIVPADI